MPQGTALTWLQPYRNLETQKRYFVLFGLLPYHEQRKQGGISGFVGSTPSRIYI